VEIKREIEALDENEGEPPSFLTQMSNGEWRNAGNDAIKNEISGEWYETVDRCGREQSCEKGDGDGKEPHFGGVIPPDKKNGVIDCRNPQSVKNVTILVLALLVIILGSLLAKKEDCATLPNPPPTETIESEDDSETAAVESETLSTVRAMDHLRCGVREQHGFAEMDSQGIWKGFEVDLCRAVAAGIFGKDRFGDGQKEPVEFVAVGTKERFHCLNNKSIDVLLSTTSQTIERSLYEVSTITWE